MAASGAAAAEREALLATLREEGAASLAGWDAEIAGYVRLKNGALTLLAAALVRGAWALKALLQAALRVRAGAGAAGARGTAAAVFACFCLWLARKLWALWRPAAAAAGATLATPVASC